MFARHVHSCRALGHHRSRVAACAPEAVCRRWRSFRGPPYMHSLQWSTCASYRSGSTRRVTSGSSPKLGVMAKSKNHTAHNQTYKQHKNGIKKQKKFRYSSRKGVSISSYLHYFLREGPATRACWQLRHRTRCGWCLSPLYREIYLTMPPLCRWTLSSSGIRFVRGPHTSAEMPYRSPAIVDLLFLSQRSA